MNARTELIALLACCVPLDRARDMADRHHAEVAGLAATPSMQESYPGELAMFRGLVGVLRVVAQHGNMAEVQRLLAEHVADEQAAYAENPALTDLAAAVQALGALPMPTGAPVLSPWERAVAGLNALADAQIPFSIELDGHIANPFGDEHIEWDQGASRWRLVHDDEDDTPAPGALAEQRHLVDPLDHVLEHLADDRPPTINDIVRALHTKHGDSEHCEHDGEVWPCPTLAALDRRPTVVLPAQRDRGTAL